MGELNLGPFHFNISYNVGDDSERVTANRRRLFNDMGIPIDRIAIPCQVHGSNIFIAANPGTYAECDALITNRSELFLTLTVADCLPIFLFDPISKSIAAVHAGWRGSQLKILDRTIKTMIDKYRVNPTNICAFIGPSAGVCCYEVGDDVVAQFDKEYVRKCNTQKYYLDVKRFNKDILLLNGLIGQNIEVSEYCTICNPKLFHSYRRDGKNSGRMLGIIGMLK
jgi:YfiH family protein